MFSLATAHTTLCGLVTGGAAGAADQPERGPLWSDPHRSRRGQERKLEMGVAGRGWEDMGEWEFQAESATYVSTYA